MESLLQCMAKVEYFFYFISLSFFYGFGYFVCIKTNTSFEPELAIG